MNKEQNLAVKSKGIKRLDETLIDKQKFSTPKGKGVGCTAESCKQSNQESAAVSKGSANECKESIIKNEFKSKCLTNSDDHSTGSESIIIYATTYRVLETGTMDELLNKNKTNKVIYKLNKNPMIQSDSIYGPLINKKIRFS